MICRTDLDEIFAEYAEKVLLGTNDFADDYEVQYLMGTLKNTGQSAKP